MTSSKAAKAAEKLRVITGPFEPETDLPAGAIDCIVFNDVLKHMVVARKKSQPRNHIR